MESLAIENKFLELRISSFMEVKLEEAQSEGTGKGYQGVGKNREGTCHKFLGRKLFDR